MSLSLISDYTQSRYGFPVLDWDHHRDGNLIGEVQFDNDIEATENFQFRSIQKGRVDIMPGSLKGFTEEKIAFIFNQIFQSYQNTTITGQQFRPLSLNLRLDSDNQIPEIPFIFIVGEKV